jgi:hypothetical protein
VPPAYQAPPIDQAPGAVGRGGLSRRVPGAHLSEILQTELRHGDGKRGGTVAQTAPSVRDPNAERAAIDSFVAGLTRASDPPADGPTNL